MNNGQKWVTDPFYLCYSDDNRENTCNNDGNNAHGLNNTTCKETLKQIPVKLFLHFFYFLLHVSHQTKPRESNTPQPRVNGRLCVNIIAVYKKFIVTRKPDGVFAQLL